MVLVVRMLMVVMAMLPTLVIKIEQGTDADCDGGHNDRGVRSAAAMMVFTVVMAAIV